MESDKDCGAHAKTTHDVGETACVNRFRDAVAVQAPAAGAYLPSRNRLLQRPRRCRSRSEAHVDGVICVEEHKKGYEVSAQGEGSQDFS